MRTQFLHLGLLGLLLSGCSTHMLEEVSEVVPPRPCTEVVKLFNTFSMRATRVAWRGVKGTAPAELTLDLIVYNDKNFPIALSNSGNGVHYAVQVSLQGKEGSVTPKDASGVVLVREGKAFKQPANPGPFGENHKRKASAAISGGKRADQTKDVNFRIKPGEPQEGRLVFQLPRGNSLLTFERKFAEKPTGAQARDLVAVCTVPENDVLAPHAPGVTGVY